ncbi:MAG: GNAT family N-acetyltransferase [Ruminococcaceae bacterium]|nr:GNAT family N-acetyltransferase [Oscillospiraceae bacterium]
MDYIIRRCTIDDTDSIRRLNREEMGYDLPPQVVRSQLELLLGRDSDLILVAETDGAVVGYVHANDYDLTYMPHMKNIMGIAVSSQHRGKGIGRALLDGVEEWARETGAVGVRLVSGATRTGAHEFYRRCGYDGGKQQLNFRKFF